MNKGILLMAYGSPDRLEDVEDYFTHIRGGRKPKAEEIENLKERYRKIGGVSPLKDITFRQAKSLEESLNGYKVYVGMKHWYPFIHETVERMALDGIKEALGIVLAPHYSRMSVEMYIQEAQRASEKFSMNMKFVRSWYNHPSFIKAWKQLINEALGRFPSKEDVFFVFTAHSLPERILQWNDPYPDQIRETAKLIAEALRIPYDRWKVAYQSAGHTNEPWLGPDVLDIIDELASEGYKNILICPVGFVSDHLEILYDIDVECKEKARELGIHLERTRSFNDDPIFIDALHDIVIENL